MVLGRNLGGDQDGGEEALSSLCYYKTFVEPVDVWRSRFRQICHSGDLKRIFLSILVLFTALNGVIPKMAGGGIRAGVKRADKIVKSNELFVKQFLRE